MDSNKRQKVDLDDVLSNGVEEAVKNGDANIDLTIVDWSSKNGKPLAGGDLRSSEDHPAKGRPFDNCYVIDRMPVDNRASFERTEFEERRSLINLKINKDLCAAGEEVSLPQLRYSDAKPNEYITEDLEFGFEDAFQDDRLITGYRDFRDRKWNFFLETIKSENLLALENPNMVSFAGPLADMLLTPYETRPWVLQAVKWGGTIFLHKTRLPVTHHNRQYGEVFPQAYCNLRFTYLFTDRDNNNIDEYEKYFVISSTKFGQHKLLTLSEVDAQDRDGRLVEMKVTPKRYTQRHEDKFIRSRLLKWWSLCAVTGQDRLLVGTRDNNNLLDGVEMLDIQEVLKTAEQSRQVKYWNHLRCNNFLSRFLDFVKTNVVSELVVYQFELNVGQKHVDCQRMGEAGVDGILPDWFRVR